MSAVTPVATPHPVFDVVYGTDLVYVSDCWKLCGDAHCCSFSRYKARFKMIARTPFQELPLLPGEYGYLRARGWDAQFGEHEHKTVEFPVGDIVIRAESIVSYKTGCACEHDTRPTICRLYPLLPVYDARGALVGVERLGIYEEMEVIGDLDPACKLKQLPFDQLPGFLRVAAALAEQPHLRFHLDAYRITKAHVAGRLRNRVQATGRDVFTAFEGAFIRDTLVDRDALRAELAALVDRYDAATPGWRAPLEGSAAG